MRIHKDPATQMYFIQRVVSYGALYRVKRVYFKTLEGARKCYN
jgi:hypothetical protein